MKAVKQALILYVLSTLAFGLLYPLALTALARPFGMQSQGDSPRLIGQDFSDPRYFWGRLSATAPVAFNAAASCGSNYGPLNQKLLDAETARVDALHQADPDNQALIPVDLVTASGSGLDPHISPEAAAYQLERVARVRGLAPDKVKKLVSQHTEGRQLGMLGEPRVNVLLLNQDLDKLAGGPAEHP